MIRPKFFLIPILFAAISTNGPVANAQEAKVVICHIPPGNPGNFHTIVVSAAAVPAHLDHGDYLGACGGGELPE
jgi:hypothetical protein